MEEQERELLQRKYQGKRIIFQGLRRLLDKGLEYDWRSKKDFCLSKALLRIGAFIRDPSSEKKLQADFDLFKKYIDTYQLFSVDGNLSALKRFPNEEEVYFKHLYAWSEP